MKEKIFLGGTCNNSTWRDELIPLLQVDSFNPQVKNWTPECQEEEDRQKEEICRIHFYCITKDLLTSPQLGLYTIAEIMDSTYHEDKITYLQIIPDGFEDGHLKSLRAVIDLVRKRGGIAFFDSDIKRSARILNYSHAK